MSYRAPLSNAHRRDGSISALCDGRPSDPLHGLRKGRTGGCAAEHDVQLNKHGITLHFPCFASFRERPSKEK